VAATFGWKHETQDEAIAVITKVHELSHAILAPYLEYYPSASMTSKDQTTSRCSSVYTSFINLEELARSEILLYNSIRIIMERLCNWEWDLFQWSEKRTTNYLDDEEEPADLDAIRREILWYGKVTEDLLTWIGWDGWVQCDRQCAVNVSHFNRTLPCFYLNPELPLTLRNG
jgi:hypothetical protein